MSYYRGLRPPRCDGDILHARRFRKDLALLQLRSGARGPFVDAMPADDRDIVLRFQRRFPAFSEPFRDASGAGVVGCRGETEVAELLPKLGQQRRAFRDRGFRIEPIGEPARPGMNCATPCAPARLDTLGWNSLSCRISRVRKETGRPCAGAEESISQQMLLTSDSP
jgi:hypothetical protein